MTSGFGALRLPADVRFGSGVSASLPEILASLGKRVFAVVDPVLAVTPAFTSTAEAIRTRGLTLEVHTDVPAELPVSEVHASGAAARAFAPDVVLGYGGGSALDAAKLVALLVTHGGELPQYYGENAVPGATVPVVAVPTTAGTGSEVTPVAVVSDPDRALKVGVSSPWLIPRVALVDPELSYGAPRSVSLFAGIDAFVHAVESFTARALPLDRSAGLLPVFVGRNLIADALSLEAAALIHRALPRIADDLTDLTARTDMARGSLLAGMAFGAAGTHLSHAIQYPIGAMTHTPHGLGTGTMLPFVLQACLVAVPERIAALGEAIGLSASGSVEARGQAAVDDVAALCERAGLPLSLRDIGITAGDADRITGLTLQVTRLIEIAPIVTDEAAISAIVTAAIAGHRSQLVGDPSIRARQEAPL